MVQGPFAHCPAGREVLDLACGTGGVVAVDAAQLAGPEGKVLGIDNNPDMLEIARTMPLVEGAPIEWHEGDVAGMPFEDGRFDVDLFQFTLMFMRDKQAVLSEFRRVLKASGLLALSVWVNGHYDQTLVKLLSRYVEPERIRSIIWDFGHSNWLQEQMEEAGFAVQSLVRSSKISHHQSLRQSLEMIADWRPLLLNLAAADFDMLVADMGGEFSHLVDGEGFHLPEEALTVVGKAV